MYVRNLTSTIFILFLTVLSACHGNMSDNDSSAKPQESVTKAVITLTDSLGADLAAYGAEAWLKYFSQSPNFFMASDGLRVFPSYDSASHVIRDTLSKELPKVIISWKEMHIDSLSSV